MALGIVLLCVGIPLFALSLWSYIQTARTDPGYPPTTYLSMVAGENTENLQLDSFKFPFHGYCEICSFPKVLRCRHCRKCGKCRLKMDHHCPWVMNCIGFYNQKYFFLFVAYSFALLLLVSLSLLIISGVQLSKGTVSAIIIIRVVVGGIFGILSLLLATLLFLHIYLITINRTTVEAMQSGSLPCIFGKNINELPPPYPCEIFSLSPERNWAQVCHPCFLI